MKIQFIKSVGLGAWMGAALLCGVSCDDALDLDPVSQITPEAYFSTADQLAAYWNNYYNNYLSMPYSGSMYHNGSWNDGLIKSDNNTDILVAGSGDLSLFANSHWQVNSGKDLQGYYGNVRVCNYFLDRALKGYQEEKISGLESLVRNYIGEGYFFRALCYYKILAYYGDAPIVTEVLEDKNEDIVAHSQRAPRNEVARFILQDLDKAIEYLADRSQFSGQRVNKQVAQVIKSRIALFEGTFEKYHKGSGRVPGDANWPGAKMSYNSGKSFNIDSEVAFFLDQAMAAAKQVAGTELTENSEKLSPDAGSSSYGWNKYFEMYSQPSLASCNEVLMWKEYKKSEDVATCVSARLHVGCNDGYTRSFIQSFLMRSGKPIYADADYKGDAKLSSVKEGRDLRLQLFVWGEKDPLYTDPGSPKNLQDQDTAFYFGYPNITSAVTETRAITGYQPKKYFTYEYSQWPNDEANSVNACPMVRTAEAMLNYMEACYEKNGSLDGEATAYWKALRKRAGVDEDFNATIAATDLSQELDLAVYSGTTQVSPMLYNIRRERVCELFSEGLRFADLIRWRSFDRLMTQKWIPEGCNFWAETRPTFDAATHPDGIWKNYVKKGLVADGSSSSTVSSPALSKYIRPFSRTQTNNELYEGYNWHEAYYLYPLGVQDLVTAASDRDIDHSEMYQNLYWPTETGYATK